MDGAYSRKGRVGQPELRIHLTRAYLACQMRVPSRMMSMIIELQGRYADKYTKGSMNACGWTNKANKSPITISVSYS